MIRAEKTHRLFKLINYVPPYLKMKCLVAIAHPLHESLCHALEETVVATLKESGHSVIAQNLYEENFHACLTANERQTYYSEVYDRKSISREIE